MLYLVLESRVKIMKKKLSKEQQEMIQQFDKAFHIVKRIAVISSFVILFVVAFESSFSTNTSYALIQNETLPETFSLKNTGTTLKQIGDIDVNIYAGTSDSGDLDQAYRVSRRRLMADSSDTYSKQNSVLENYPGLLYILENNDFKTNNANLNYYLTQLAVWWYLDLKNGYSNDIDYCDTIEAGIVSCSEVAEDDRYLVNNLSVSDKQTITNDEDFGSMITDIVTKALSYQEPATATVTLPKEEDITYHIIGNYLETNDITVSSLNQFATYQVKVDSSDVEIVDSTGQIKKDTFMANEPFRLRVAMDKIKNNQISLDVTVVANIRHLNGYLYRSSYSEPGPYSQLVLGSVDKETLTGRIQVDYNLETGSVTIYKVDAQTDKALAGATFVVMNSKGNQVAKFTTTNQPYELVLPTGNYTLKETIVPDNYSVENQDYPFTVEKDTKTEVKVTNTKEIAVPNTSLNAVIIYCIGGISVVLGAIFILLAVKPHHEKKK